HCRCISFERSAESLPRLALDLARGIMDVVTGWRVRESPSDFSLGPSASSSAMSTALGLLHRARRPHHPAPIHLSHRSRSATESRAPVFRGLLARKPER